MTGSTAFLLECLHRAGMRDVVAVQPAEGGLAAHAGIATRGDVRDGGRVATATPISAVLMCVRCAGEMMTA